MQMAEAAKVGRLRRIFEAAEAVSMVNCLNSSRASLLATTFASATASPCATRAASAASPSARVREAPQPAAAAKDPGDLSHATPPFRERSEGQETEGHQQSLPGFAKKGEAARQHPEPHVGSGFDVDSDNSKPETFPPLNINFLS